MNMQRQSIVRPACLAILLGLSVARSAQASGPLIVDVKTTEGRTSYSLDKGGLRLDGDPKTPNEIEAWLRDALKLIGNKDAVFIRSDNRTPLKTVLEMLQRFKAAGAKRFVVNTYEEGEEIVMLTGSCDEVRVLPNSK